MHITFQDLAVFIGFFVVVIGLSVWKSRKPKGHVEDSSDFFLAGRGLTWPLIGISIVAANISTEQMVGMAGQAAGSTGLAVSCWQLLGSVSIVIISMTLLPKFLRAGIYTMPEYLEYRYNAAARGMMAALTVVIYAVVMLPAVLYSGGLTLRAITGIELSTTVWIVGLIGAGYSAIGGLKAIAWADLVQGLSLLVGGLLIFFLGLNAVGGWDKFAEVNADKLHMILPSDNKDLPWSGMAGGMWIVMIYYCGLNQFIVQRNLAAKSLKHGFRWRAVADRSLRHGDARDDGAAIVLRSACGKSRCRVSHHGYPVGFTRSAGIYLRGYRRCGHEHAGVPSQFRFDNRNHGYLSPYVSRSCFAKPAGLDRARSYANVRDRRLYDRPHFG